MTQETTCPACGAPLVVTGQKDMITCTFCGADLVIQDESGTAAFRVVGQPEPQKETLSKPVEGRGNEIGGAQIYQESLVEDAQAIPPAEGAPIPATQFGTNDPALQPDLVSSGARVYTASEERKGMSGATRWLAIGGAALLGLILLCVCLVFVFMAVMRRNGF